MGFSYYVVLCVCVWAVCVWHIVGIQRVIVGCGMCGNGLEWVGIVGMFGVEYI